jgi:head-tail adaptor
MRAGRLRHRVIIEAPAQSMADDGGAVETWVAGDTVWASIEPLNMREKELAASINANLTHRVTMRGRALPPSYRLRFGTRLLYPSSVLDPAERGIELNILAIETIPAL